MAWIKPLVVNKYRGHYVQKFIVLARADHVLWRLILINSQAGSTSTLDRRVSYPDCARIAAYLREPWQEEGENFLVVKALEHELEINPYDTCTKIFLDRDADPGITLQLSEADSLADFLEILVDQHAMDAAPEPVFGL